MGKAGYIFLVIFIGGLATALYADVVIKEKSTVETGAIKNVEPRARNISKATEAAEAAQQKWPVVWHR